MPSTFPDGDGRLPRRRVLAGVGATMASGLAGCSGRLPGTEPEQLTAETTVEDDDSPRIVWRYPPREGDKDGIGYAAVEIDRTREEDDWPSAMHLTFNSTIGRIASRPPYEDYRPDWFRFRIWPPTTYEGRLSHQVRVEPPGQWKGFAAYYEIQAGARRTVVELRDVDTQGTIEIPAVFDPGMESLPDRLHCSFTVQASRPDPLGKTVRVAGQDSLPLGYE